jgi:hypothetical protein
MILFIEKSTWKLLELIKWTKQSCRLQDKKHKNQVFLYTSNGQSKQEIQ